MVETPMPREIGLVSSAWGPLAGLAAAAMVALRGEAAVSRAVRAKALRIVAEVEARLRATDGSAPPEGLAARMEAIKIAKAMEDAGREAAMRERSRRDEAGRSLRE